MSDSASNPAEKKRPIKGEEVDLSLSLSQKKRDTLHPKKKNRKIPIMLDLSLHLGPAT